MPCRQIVVAGCSFNLCKIRRAKLLVRQILLDGIFRFAVEDFFAGGFLRHDVFFVRSGIRG